jgi:hypothetical protein
VITLQNKISVFISIILYIKMFILLQMIIVVLIRNLIIEIVAILYRICILKKILSIQFFSEPLQVRHIKSIVQSEITDGKFLM